MYCFRKRKERDLTQSYDKSPYTDRDTFGEVNCMQVIPFPCVFFISDGTLFGDDVKNIRVRPFYNGYMTSGGRSIRNQSQKQYPIFTQGQKK